MTTDTKNPVTHIAPVKLAAIFDSFDSRPSGTASSVLRAARLGDQLWSQLAESPIGASQTESIRRALLSANVSVQDLEHFKGALTYHWEGSSIDHQGVLMLFYHAVIARAYALHGQWITSRQREASLPFYQDRALILRHCDLGRVFVDACRVSEVD